MLIIKEFKQISYNKELNKVEAVINENGKDIVIRRTPRKHTQDIRKEFKQGIIHFEIQGVMYCYKLENGIMKQYRKPEDFRSESRITDSIRREGRRTKARIKDNKVVLPISEVKETKKEEEKEVRHKKYNTIKTCIENDIPVYLVGEAGTGKNYTLEQISWELGLEFYFTNSVQQEYKLTGFIDAGGVYHETEFYKAFKNGGIFFLDEIDASIPEVLVLLNAAIANRYFEFPNGKIKAHKNFRVVAAGNTVGSGADEMYSGRLVLDQATLDRFVIIEFDYDRNIEMHLAHGNTELVDFVRELRESAKQSGIRATFSYRCITMVTKLEKTGLPLDEILIISVFKGMTKDTINTLNVTSTNKYSYQLNKLKGVT